MAKKNDPETTEEVVEEEPTTEESKTSSSSQQEDYEARFKGLQRTFNTAQKKLQTLEEREAELLEQAETSKQSEKTLKDQLEKLQKGQDDAKAELDRLSGELATQSARNERMQLILAEFSDLAPFEADGLLPDAVDADEMVQKFTAFREALQKSIQANVERQVVGTSPTDSGTTATKPVRTKEQIYSRLMNLAGSRDDDKRQEYSDLLAEWDEINS